MRLRERRGMGCRLARPGAQPPPDVGGAEPAARLREEQRARSRVARRSSAGRPRARYRSIARSACSPAGTIRVLPPLPSTRTDSESKSTDSRSSETSSSARSPERVRELEQRAVAQLQRRCRRDPVKQRRDLVGSQHARQALRLLRRAQQLGRVLAARTELDLVAKQPAQRGQLARDRRGRLAALREPGCVAAQRPYVDRRGLEARRSRPRRRTDALSIAYAWRVLTATARRRRSSSKCSSALRHDGLIAEAVGGLVSGALIGALLFAVIGRHPAWRVAQAM